MINSASRGFFLPRRSGSVPERHFSGCRTFKFLIFSDDLPRKPMSHEIGICLSGGEICRQTGCIESGFLIVVPDGHLGKWGQGFQKDRMEITNNDGMKKCQYCKGGCIRKGMRDGIQMFRCKTCARYQRDEYRYKAHEPGTDDRIALYVREGVGIRSTARIMKISPTTVIGRIKKIAAAIKPPPLKEGRHYEMDELCTYAGNKADRTYVAYALDRKSGEVAGLVVGRRTKSNLRKVLDRVVGANAKRITTDGLDLYRYLVGSVPERHFFRLQDI
jgi:insertion element IS1 protein InsB